MKRILTIAIAISLLFNTLICATATESENARLSGTTDILTSLSFYKPVDKMENSQDYLTREEMARILSVFVDGERNGEIVEYSGSSYYSDVEAAHRSAYEIMLVTGSGIMSGYTDGTFKPENKVRYIEALKTFVALLGYDIAAQQKGGWTEGYKNLAVQLGLVKGVNLSEEDFMTKGDFTQLLWNSLDVKVLEYDAVTSNGDHNAQRGEILLNKMDIYEVKGVFTATDKTALFGYENCESDYIRIGDILVYTEENYAGFLGRNVRAFYKYDEDRKPILKYLDTDMGRNKLTVIPAKDISEKTTTKEFVYFDGKTEKSVSIKSDTSVIFNGRRLTYFSLEHLKPVTGRITLIEAVNGGITLFIESYVDYFVTSVYNDGTTLKIADNNGKAPVTLDLKYAEENITVKKGSEILSTDVLKRGMLISVAGDKMESDGKGGFIISEDSEEFTILVGGKTIVSEISAMDLESNIVTVDDVDYELSQAIDLQKSDIMLGETSVLYFNALGEIAKIHHLAAGDTVSYIDENLEAKTAAYSGGEKYGFIKEASGGKGLDSSVYVNMFTQDGEFVTLTATERTELDGVKYKKSFTESFLENLQKARDEFKVKTGLDVINGSSYEQLVRYSLDKDGKFQSIDTIIPNYSAGSEAEKDCFRFSMLMKPSGVSIPGVLDEVKIQGLTDDRRIDGSGTARNLEGVAGLVENDVTFSIPYDLEAEKAYSIINLFNIKEKRSPIMLFDMDEFQMARAAIMQGTSQGTALSHKVENMMLVTKKIKKLDEEDEYVDTLVGYSLLSDKEVEVLVSEEIIDKVAKIDPGDIIRWNLNSHGKANVIDITCTFDYENAETLTSDKQTSSYNAEWRFTYGAIQRLSEKRALVKYEGAYFPETYPLTYVKTVYHVDTDSMVITKGDLSMIKSIDDFGETDASKVFMYHDYSKPVALVIFN